jgi:hypothetical protein
MTKFEDQLYQELMAEHGHRLRALRRPAPVRRRVRRPVWLATGAAGANVILHAMGARVRVVPVRPGCPPIGSLPHPRPAPHPAVSVMTGVNGHGHRSVTVRVGKGGIPAGDAMILAFTGSPRSGSLGAGGIITGRVPRYVSLPSAPHGGAAPADPVAQPGPGSHRHGTVLQ